jgi:uncharacterized protein (TIGR00255 family)
MALVSMTGFGAAAAAAAGGRVSVEVSSVNRKQAEVAVSLPRDWSALEASVRDVVMGVLKRGRVQVGVVFTRGAPLAGGVDLAAARSYAAAHRAVCRALDLTDALTAREVLGAPGVLGGGGWPDAGDVEDAVLAAVRRAVTAWERMRQTEGRSLERYFKSALRGLRAGAARVAKRSAGSAARHAALLRRRLEQAGVAAPLADPAMQRELVLFADRVDITEELTRLGSHFAQFERVLAAESAPGRKLEFLMQEMGREVNTIGSKAADVTISHEVVEMKTALEKMREQVQNVE